MKKTIIVILSILTSTSFHAQKWVEMASKPNANFYEIQKEFYKSFEDKDITIKSTGYKAFKRWEYFVGPRVYPSGDLSVLAQLSKNYTDFLIENNINTSDNFMQAAAPTSATWVPVGPMGAPTGLVGGFARKAGRDNFLTFMPSNTLTIFAGAAGGGLWKSTNGGTSWSTNTDNLPVTAVSDLAIDPTNTLVMYLATGGADDLNSGTPSPSGGLLKTTDGGISWVACGLTFSVSQNRVISKVLIDPSNSQVILVATSVGIYKSINGGLSFIAINSSLTWDLKYHPTNPNIVYASGTVFSRSTNGGSSFTTISSGIPISGSNRMQIAVTPINPNNIYVLASKSADSQFLGVYRSSDSGLNFTTASTSPNIIGNSCSGNSTGQGQGWYDLAIAASPTNSNEIVVGGVNVWRSTNDGTSWTNIGCWIGSASTYVHADIHELEYAPNGRLYSSNDGGIFYYSGNSWIDITAQRNIAQIYKIGLSALTPNLWITGHQDNGSNIKNGANYIASLAGDGMDCFIDRTNNSIMYAEQYNGSFNRSTNGGASWTGITSGITGTGAWVTPWKQDPVASIIYGGRQQMFKSTNNGTNWTQMGTTGGTGSIIEFAIAPSNNQVIYVLYSGSIRKTTDGGLTWANASGTFPGNPTFITINPTDPNNAWVTKGDYSAGQKVYQTTNGGTSWSNVSSNLPNLPANCSVYEPGSNNRIYIGMDVGIYYKDNSSSSWTLYNAGLPNTAVMDLEMSPASPGTIYAATFGRGVYSADVVPVSAAPVSDFSFAGSMCVGSPKTLIDNSSNTPSNWNWTISPMAGVVFNSSSVQSPTLTFSNAGIYTISLVSGNSFGQGAIITKTILVSNTPTIVLSSNNISSCDQDPVTITASGANTYTWSNFGGNNASATYTFGINFTYTVSSSNNGCVSSQTVEVTIINCLGVLELSANNSSFNVYPNPVNDFITLKINAPKELNVAVELLDAAGKLILKENASFTKEKADFKLNISSLSAGIYYLKLNSKKESSQTLKILKE